MNSLLSLTVWLASATVPTEMHPVEKSAPSAVYQEIQDLSNLPSLNPDLADRKTAKLRLCNGLQVLLVSDPKADQSAAAMTVEVGSWNDPAEYPGMAHFCEHMLFIGTQKYPNENEFFTVGSNYGSSINAYTAPQQTVYTFSCQTPGFLDLLDRFAHFFIDPLFSPGSISRELHAVDQEFAKNIENDGWREYMIFKETGNPNHPNKGFSTGNSQTLSQIPPDALKKWHADCYGANRMYLVIYSSLPLEELKQTVAQIFPAIPEAKADLIPSNFSLTSDEQRGHILYIQPIQNRRSLSLSWELPQDLAVDPSKSAGLVAYALQRGQKANLYENLKQEQWIDSMSVRVDNLGGNTHRFFQINLDLTQKGIEDVQAVIQRCFQAVAGLKETGVPSYLFQERNAMAQLTYQFRGRTDAYDFVTQIADSLPEEPLSTFPRNLILATQYNPQKVQQTIAFLTPENCSLSLMAPSELTQVLPERKEKWMGAAYTIRSIPDAWSHSWASALPHPQIRLAQPNPFLPTQLATVPDPALGTVPTLFARGDIGQAYYARCPEFASPHSVIHLHIQSPELQPNARSQVLASLYLDHLTDQLHPTLAAASAAGLSCHFDLDRSRIHLQIGGFSEKAPLLLQEVIKQMPLNPPTPEQFALYVDRHEKSYSNGQKELAIRQAKELLDSLVNQDRTTKQQRLAALKTIRHEDLLAFHQKVFEKTYLQALFAGNLSLQDAESAWLDIVHVLGKTPYPTQEHAKTKVLSLPDKAGPYCISQTVGVQGNAAILLIDEGDFTFEKRVSQEILGSTIREAFFTELRTKQKTAYIAQSECTELEERLFRSFLVQSNSHEPEELLYRFELFLEEYHASLAEQIGEARFETIKQSQINSLKTRYRNLKEKSSLWNYLAFQQKGDFAFVDKKIQAYQALSYETFLKHASQFLSRDNHKRLAVLYKGRIATPFAYEPIGVPQLEEIAAYTTRPVQTDELEKSGSL